MFWVANAVAISPWFLLNNLIGSETVGPKALLSKARSYPKENRRLGIRRDRARLASLAAARCSNSRAFRSLRWFTALATQNTAQADYAFLEFFIEKEVAAAYADALLASEEVQLLEEGMLELVQDNMNLVQQAYLQGEEVEIIEVITAQRTFVETQTAYLEALYSFNAAVVNLETVLGGEAR